MSNKPNRISKIFSFTFYEYQVIIKSWLLYVKWDFRISKTHYKNWQAYIIEQPINLTTNKPLLNACHQFEHKQIKALITLNEIAGRNHYKHMNCLRRCLCQKELLNGINIQSKLHIGVKFVGGKLAAHSWLSCSNIIINDSNELVSTYQELKTLNDSQTLALFK